MRLFVAIPFSEKFDKYLKELQGKLPEAKMRLNGHFHITLQFLGDVQPEKVDEIKEQLTKIIFKPFKVKLENLGVFKNKKGYIRVAWVGISFPEELKELQKQVEENLREVGFELDKPFSPHLTLARIKFTDDKKFEEELKKISVENFEETVEKIVLYQSHLSREGAEYKELLTIP
jgi:2'-5' RNA ligase